MADIVTTINTPLASKINWISGIGFIVSILATFGLNITPETQNMILQAITLVGMPLIMILRTWFTAKT